MIEFGIAKAVNEFGMGTWIDGVSELISSRLFLALLFIVIFLFIASFDRKKGMKIAIAAMVAFSLYYLINEIMIKEVISSLGWERLRPYLAYPNEIIPLGNLNTDSSFPSSHLASLTAIVFVLSYYYKKKWVWALSILAVIVMAFSRIHNGMHYPSDALFGILFGLVYGYFAVRITNYFSKDNKKTRRKRRR